MGTRIDTKSRDGAGALALEDGPLLPEVLERAKVSQGNAFLKDRFEDRDPSEAAWLPPSTSATDESLTKKAFDLMLDEKCQPGTEFMISSPTGNVAIWWNDLASLIETLPPENYSYKVQPLDAETRELLFALHETAPHRTFTVA
jgi:hypothetical protein